MQQTECILTFLRIKNIYAYCIVYVRVCTVYAKGPRAQYKRNTTLYVNEE
jgi:hypothetical protein